MTLRAVISALLALVLAGAALAEAPESSLRPAPRPAEAALVRVSATAPARSLRPVPRPVDAVVTAVAAAAPAPAPAPIQDPITAFLSSLTGTRPAAAAGALPSASLAGVSDLAVARSLHPAPRPRDLVTRVAAIGAKGIVATTAGLAPLRRGGRSVVCPRSRARRSQRSTVGALAESPTRCG